MPEVSKGTLKGQWVDVFISAKQKPHLSLWKAKLNWLNRWNQVWLEINWIMVEIKIFTFMDKIKHLGHSVFLHQHNYIRLQTQLQLAATKWRGGRLICTFFHTHTHTLYNCIYLTVLLLSFFCTKSENIKIMLALILILVFNLTFTEKICS